MKKIVAGAVVLSDVGNDKWAEHILRCPGVGGGEEQQPLTKTIPGALERNQAIGSTPRNTV